MSFLTFVFFYVLVFVQAVPLVKRIVVSPHITEPTGTTTWIVGETVTVEWDTSEIPPPGNFTGQVLLGNLTAGSENLNVDNPLAQDFLLSTGKVQFTVPNVPTGTHYIVVLFGDSGNRSPPFTITSGSSTNTTPSPSSTSSTPPHFSPLSPIPVSPAPLSPPPAAPTPSPPVSTSVPVVSPTSTSTPPSPTTTSPSIPVSSPSSSTPTVSTASNTPSTSGSTPSSNSALPALHARGGNAMSLCVAAAAMSLVLVL